MGLSNRQRRRLGCYVCDVESGRAEVICACRAVYELRVRGCACFYKVAAGSVGVYCMLIRGCTGWFEIGKGLDCRD